MIEHRMGYRRCFPTLPLPIRKPPKFGTTGPVRASKPHLRFARRCGAGDMRYITLKDMSSIRNPVFSDSSSVPVNLIVTV